MRCAVIPDTIHGTTMFTYPILFNFIYDERHKRNIWKFEDYNLLNRIRSNEPPFENAYQKADVPEGIENSGITLIGTDKEFRKYKIPQRGIFVFSACDSKSLFVGLLCKHIALRAIHRQRMQSTANMVYTCIIQKESRMSAGRS